MFASFKNWPVLTAAALVSFSMAAVAEPKAYPKDASKGQSASAEVVASKEATEAATAHSVVEDVTGKMIGLIKTNETLLAENPVEYFARIGEVLDPVVHFEYIARSVMGSHGKIASKEQRQAFAKVFRETMVETIAKGMTNYADSEIAVREPEADAEDKRRVSVLQDVKGDDGNHIVAYTMQQTRSGEWLLTNVVLNGVNLGKSFRDQFTQSMRQYSNDIDTAIANWGKQSS